MASTPSILIIGGGAFGTSTAYHLSLRGYVNVIVLDRFEPPSKEAAATDLNKIVRCEYPNDLYTKLAQEAMQIWRDPDGLLSHLFSPTGWIMASHELARSFLQSSFETSQRSGGLGVEFLDVEETKRRFPEFTGSFKGWTNLWSPEAGWVCKSLLFPDL